MPAIHFGGNFFHQKGQMIVGSVKIQHKILMFWWQLLQGKSSAYPWLSVTSQFPLFLNFAKSSGLHLEI